MIYLNKDTLKCVVMCSNNNCSWVNEGKINTILALSSLHRNLT